MVDMFSVPLKPSVDCFFGAGNRAVRGPTMEQGCFRLRGSPPFLCGDAMAGMYTVQVDLAD